MLWLFVFLGAVVSLLLVYKLIESIIALSKPSVECPSCGRNINIVGNSPTCYKCRTKLIKHADGTYIKA